MKRLLIDTNAYSHLLAGNKIVLEAISNAEMVYMSVFVIAELYYGFRGGSKEIQNREILNKFLEKPTVQLLNSTLETAEYFSMIKNDLKLSGTPIPIQDIWIASHAMEIGSTLITFDKHFEYIKGLRIWHL